jgi:hypothetical protein
LKILQCNWWEIIWRLMVINSMLKNPALQNPMYNTQSIYIYMAR